jgi:hypothetical protein
VESSVFGSPHAPPDDHSPKTTTVAATSEGGDNSAAADVLPAATVEMAAVEEEEEEQEEEQGQLEKELELLCEVGLELEPEPEKKPVKMERQELQGHSRQRTGEVKKGVEPATVLRAATTAVPVLVPVVARPTPPPPSPSTPAKASRGSRLQTPGQSTRRANKSKATTPASFTPLDESGRKSAKGQGQMNSQARRRRDTAAATRGKTVGRQQQGVDGEGGGGGRRQRTALGSLTSPGSRNNPFTNHHRSSNPLKSAALGKGGKREATATALAGAGAGYGSPGGYVDLRGIGGAGTGARNGLGVNALRLAMFRAKHGGPSVGGARSRLSMARVSSASSSP